MSIHDKDELALFGGAPVRSVPFPPHPVIGDAEKQAVMEVLDSGRLSSFIAAPGVFFLGGERIKELERRFAEAHGVAHAVSFNSATAALHAAVVAVGVQPGDEVIVPPYTFTSTATCALMQNAVPVFADIEADYYCLDPAAAEAAITGLTRALVPVHLFGQPADIHAVVDLARRRGVKVIEDCAQAPFATVGDRRVGTFGDCGIFSFTESKTMTTGEGGMLITDDPEIARIAQMVRNHGEMIVEGQKSRSYRTDFLGWNYRMTEMEAALGIVQLGRLPELNETRVRLADHLSKGLADLPGLAPPALRPGSQHVYYVYPFTFDEDAAGCPRADFVRAMAAEGIPLGAGYVAPLYMSPIYQDRAAAAFRHYEGSARYDKGLCPVTERMYEREVVLTGVARAPATEADMDDIVAAAAKVLGQAHRLG